MKNNTPLFWQVLWLSPSPDRAKLLSSAEACVMNSNNYHFEAGGSIDMRTALRNRIELSHMLKPPNKSCGRRFFGN